MYNRQTDTFVRPPLSHVSSAKTSSLHATVQGGTGLVVCTASLRVGGTVSANALRAPQAKGKGKERGRGGGGAFNKSSRTSAGLIEFFQWLISAISTAG